MASSGKTSNLDLSQFLGSDKFERSDYNTDMEKIDAAVEERVEKNASIVGATKTKITYDAKGLITGGAEANTDDIAEGSSNLYFTNARADARADDRITAAVTPVCILTHSTTQSIAGSTQVALLFNTETIDNVNMHSTASNTSRITFQHAGVYQINASIKYGTYTSGVGGISIRKNGTTFLDVHVHGALSGTNNEISISGADSFAVGDYIEITAYQTYATPLTMAAGATRFSAFRIAAL